MAGLVLKIVIEDTHPPVWRRIIIPEKITFADLHEMIQIVFGWEDEHLHEFRIPSKSICIDNNEEAWDRYHYMEEETPVDDFLMNHKWVRYTYDFGDEWRHKIIYEKTDETYGERYATLLKFKGDNFMEDSGGVWEEDEEEIGNRVYFDRAIVADELKGLTCPVCNKQVESMEEITPETLRGLLDDLMEKMDQKMKYVSKQSVSETTVSLMAQKIDAWKEFVENWDDTAQNDRWEITVSECKKEKQCGKTNYELLQALNYQEAKDYCKYLQIPVLNTWTKEQLVKAVADTFAEHPEYFLYVLYKDEYAEFVKLMKLPGGERKEKPKALDCLIKGAALGLVDISIDKDKNGRRAKLAFPSDIETLFLPLNTKKRNEIYRKLQVFSDNLKCLLLFYGIVELEALYKIYCQVYRVEMDHTEFNRCVYWYGRFNNLFMTATTENGVSYAIAPELDIETIVERTDQFAGDLEYAIYSKKELKKMTDDMSERNDWLDVLFTCLHFEMGISQSVAGSMIEGVFGCIMNGDTLSIVMRNLEETMNAMGIKTEISSKCEVWGCISGLMLELELPMLKGRSRNRYGEEKRISPWRVGMCEISDGNTKTNSRTKRIQEFPIEIQEMMYNACSFADRDAMKRLLRYRKEEKIQSEEFLYLLTSAHITGCEFDQAGKLLRELENGSKQAKKAVGLLRMRLENGVDVVDEPWNLLNDSWEPVEPLQQPFVRKEPKSGRNDPCPCGSGKKYKHCCGK